MTISIAQVMPYFLCWIVSLHFQEKEAPSLFVIRTANKILLIEIVLKVSKFFIFKKISDGLNFAFIFCHNNSCSSLTRKVYHKVKDKKFQGSPNDPKWDRFTTNQKSPRFTVDSFNMLRHTESI